MFFERRLVGKPFFDVCRLKDFRPPLTREGYRDENAVSPIKLDKIGVVWKFVKIVFVRPRGLMTTRSQRSSLA